MKEEELPPLDLRVLVFNNTSGQWLIDYRSKSDLGSDGWSWQIHNKRQINSWHPLPEKPSIRSKSISTEARVEQLEKRIKRLESLIGKF